MKWASRFLSVGVCAAAACWSSSMPAGFVIPKLLIVSACVMLAAAALALDPVERCRRLDLPMLACLAALAISCWFSVDWRLSLEGRYGHWELGAWACLLYAALLSLSAAAPVPRGIVGALGAILGLQAYLQTQGLDPFVRPDALPAGLRAIGTIGNPPSLGALLAMLAMVAGPLQIPFIMAGLVASGSRGAVLAAAMGLVARIFPRKAHWVMLAAFVVWLAAPVKAPKDIARAEVWGMALNVWGENFLAGSGPDTFEIGFRANRTPDYAKAVGSEATKQEHAHNDLLQIAATMGLLGLASYAFLLGHLEATPAMIALFVAAKFNMPSFIVIAIGCVIFGSQLHVPVRASDTRWPWIAIALIGYVSMALSVLIMRADLLAGEGRYSAALNLRPCTVSYAAESFKKRDGWMLLDAEGAARCHPLSAQAHIVYGSALLSNGWKKHGLIELEIAQRLDPKFGPLADILRKLRR